MYTILTLIERVSEWLLFNPKMSNISVTNVYHNESKLHLMRWQYCPLCTRPTRLAGFYSVNSLKQQSIDPLWFRANQYLFLHLNDVCLAKQFHSPWFDPIGTRTQDLTHSILNMCHVNYCQKKRNGNSIWNIDPDSDYTPN